jgi:hypothetical protein
MFPFICIPAYDLPVYASQWVLPPAHARLGTRLLARLCRGGHSRPLNFMRFQGATPHRTERARFAHRAPT